MTEDRVPRYLRGVSPPEKRDPEAVIAEYADRLAAAERFVAAWDRSMDVATAHAMSGYIRNTPEQRREAEEAWQAVLDARAELDWGGQPKEPSTYALRPTTFAPGRRVPGRT
jgi:hypothetical protein